MIVYILFISLAIIALYGYSRSIKMTPLERDIRKTGIEYECYECKKKFSVNLRECPDCGLITIYGTRRKNYWKIIPILMIIGVMFAKFFKIGMFDLQF